MKFGRYLEENQTPEWKRAYINYRACKKAIKVVARRLGQEKKGEEEGSAGQDSSDDVDHGPSAVPKRASPMASAATPSMASREGRASNRATPSIPGSAPQQYGATVSTPREIPKSVTSPPPLDLGEPSVPEHSDSQLEAQRIERMPSRTRGRGGTVTFNSKDQHPGDSPPASPEESQGRISDEGMVTSDSNAPLRAAGDGGSRSRPQSKAGRSPRTPFSLRASASPRFFKNSPRLPSASGPSPKLGNRSIRSMTMPSPRLSVRSAKTFDELYEHCEPDERAFFDLLDRELEKVETFYQARLQDALRRAHELRDQLRELAEHRRIYHEIYPEGMPEWETRVTRILPGSASAQVFSNVAGNLQRRVPFLSREPDSGTKSSGGENGQPPAGTKGPNGVSISEEHKALREAMEADKDHRTYSPERYQKYKKDLKAAVLEFYRQLELVKNYRIMNLTGFRKALKKFEKTTKIHCMELYTDERIAPESFSKSETIDDLLKQVEELYSEHFEKGDTKKARDHLRKQTTGKTHYRSTFRSGLYIGIGLPAAIFALVQSQQPDTHQELPGYEGLLYLYGALYLPVLFALLFELNLDAWVSARINYEFVMELSRPTLDFRSYLEMPAFLFLTLSYCFFLTMARVGSSNIDPTSWPAIWLVFVVIFFFNPIPALRRRSRYWFLRVLFRVITPGYSRVEFIAFFIADELNSLVFTLQSFFLLGCGYGHHWPANVFQQCRVGQNWISALLLCLPALSRLIQCLKRYHDSKLKIHLINAGKYLSSICQYILYTLWRSRGARFSDPAFVVWIFVAFIASSYTSAWDLIVDWSLFRPKSGFLRPDLGYANRLVYYVAIVTNVLIRFVWVWYLPHSASYLRTRSFFFALAEMLRRWQWNFFRVETEHLGNADAYRVTREIPLPYRRVDHDSDEEIKRDDPVSVHLDKIRKSLTRGTGRGPDELDVGPRGHARSREYEARRPGDTRARDPEDSEV